MEFALILIPLLTLIFGMVQYGLYFYSAQSGSHVTSRTVRQLSVGNCQDATLLKGYVYQQLGAATNASSVNDPKFKVSVVNTGGTNMIPFASADVGETVTLKVEFPTINMRFPFVPFLSDSTVKRTIEARVEDTTDEGCPGS